MPSLATTTGFAMLLCLNARSVSFASSGLSSTSRMILSAVVILRFSEGERKGRAVARLGFGPNGSGMSPNDPLDDRQADSGSRKLVRVMQSLERAEELFCIRH